MFWLIVVCVVGSIFIYLLFITFPSIFDFNMTNDPETIYDFIAYRIMIFLMILPFLLSIYIMTRKWHKRNLRKIFSSNNWGLILFGGDVPIPVEKNNSDKD